MFRYAQINSDGYVVGESFLNGEVQSDNMIPIEQDFDLTNKKYNKESQQWEIYEPEPQPQPEPQPTLEEQLSEVQEQLDSIEEVVESTALTTEYMACLQEVNAE